MLIESLERPGSYVLVFRCRRAVRPAVGALGPVVLARGWLFYAGSGFGPGGLGGRLRHHLRLPTRPRWHVDHLRPHVTLVGAWCHNGTRALEHRWAQALAEAASSSIPRRGLGSSDCRCPAHLVHFERRPRERELGEVLSRAAGETPRFVSRELLVERLAV